MKANFRNKYYVTEDGDVCNVRTGRWLKGKLTWDGYNELHLRFNGKSKYIRRHRVVAEVFYGPSNLEVNHKDGDRLNNHKDNLEYSTSSENKLHSINVLGHSTVENLPDPIMCCLIHNESDEVEYFRSQKDMAKRLDVSHETVGRWFKNNNFHRSKLSKKYNIVKVKRLLCRVEDQLPFEVPCSI